MTLNGIPQNKCNSRVFFLTVYAYVSVNELHMYALYYDIYNTGLGFYISWNKNKGAVTFTKINKFFLS